ncbi:MAG: hypothetical protein CMF96_09485 [Candidatus Marinimicrobia bacterium]|nr:hypothetical protein [Candidatus Neomarinimicrobiota bacterium]
MIKFKYIFITLIFNSIFSQGVLEYGPAEQWEAVTSTSQGFILIDEITVDGEAVAGGEMDGSNSTCPEQNCDILVAVFNNVPVGWNYCTYSNGDITITVNLNDGISQGVEGYPQYAVGVLEPVVSFHFYDASEQKVFYNVYSSEVQPMNFIENGSINIIDDGVFQSGVTVMGNWQPHDLGDAVCPLAYADNFTALGGSGNEAACDIPYFTCGNDLACNYYDTLNTCENGEGDCSSDEGCILAEENFDCNGNCLEEDDCTGECGGTAVFDDCGICNGGNVDMDCAGECGGTAVFDDCGICNGGNVDMDCAGVCFGDAMFDNCGTCDNDTSNDCIEDCNGEFGGDALLDMCGICDNNLTNDCVQDCNGDWGGDALLDICGTCDNNPINDCIQDCNGDWGGDAIIDDCGFCALGLTGLGANIADSEGFVTGPNADCLGVCFGNVDFIGSTGNLDENGYDCNNDCAGLATIDDCGICAGGNTGNVACSCPDWQRDCLGNCPGSIYLANDIIYQYNSDSELLDSGLISESVDGNVYISASTLESMFGDQWNADNVEVLLGSTGFCYLNDELTGETCAIEGETDTCGEGSCFLLNIELGFDCNGNCAGNHLIDCSGECLLSGTNQLTSECSDTYMDEYGIVETDCDSISNESEGDMLYCCAQEYIDCNDSCYGNYVTDIDEQCCEPELIGCDGNCGDAANPPATADACGECDGENVINEFGFVTGPDAGCDGICNSGLELDACGICNGANIFLNENDNFITGPNADCLGVCDGNAMIDCAGVCNGDAAVNTYYLDNDQDGLGSIDSMNFCSVDVPENWVINSDDLDDNCFSNIHDCAGICDGTAVLDCLDNCSDSEDYIGNFNNLDAMGFDCNSVCEGDAEVDLCGVCAGGDTSIDYCSCEDWEKDCSGNCPGFTFLGNILELQYNSSEEYIGEYMVTDENGNNGLNESYFINMYGQSWLDTINISDIILGYDCAGNCQGEEYIDCQGVCSSESDFLGNTEFLDENGYDCQGECGGGAYEDICEICYENGFDEDLVNIGMCYLNGVSTDEYCMIGELGDDTCLEGFCFIQGNNADQCGECFGNNQCVYNISTTTEDQYPDISVAWNLIESEEVVTYFIYRNNQLIFETHNNSFNDNALEFGTQYCYKIAAEIGDDYIEYINDYEDCITTTTMTPNYIFSFPEVINTPPNYPLNIPINLEGLQSLPISEMTVVIHYDPLVFTPIAIEGLNSFSIENYNIEINSMGGGQINFYVSLPENNNAGLEVDNEQIFIISGFSGDGSIDSGIISAEILYPSPVLQNLYYDGTIEISDFYVSIIGSIDYYSNGQKTSNVDLSLAGYTSLNQYFADNTTTNYSGEFSFYGILPGAYNVTATKNNVLDIGGELSSTDASQIARNSVGLIEFTNYQRLAADVTMNGSVSGLDASKVARFRIGQIDALNEQNIHWIFYPEVLDVEDLIVSAINDGNSLISADCVYNPNVIGNTCSGGVYRNMPCSEAMVNSSECPMYLSIRLGDVTGNWNPSPLISMVESRMNPVEFFIEDEYFSLPIKLVENVEVQGVDIVIEFNNDFFQLENIIFLENELYSLGYNLVYNQNEGEILISSFATMELAFIEEFVNIQFSKINSDFETSDIKINQFYINESNTESGFEIIDEYGNINITDHVIINSTELSSSELNFPKTFNLYQNYPNPFNPDTEIHFDLPIVTNVSIGIYDIMGNKIIELINEKNYSAGKYNIKWNASKSPGGIYFCRMKAGKYIKTHKMILLK